MAATEAGPAPKHRLPAGVTAYTPPPDPERVAKIQATAARSLRQLAAVELQGRARDAALQLAEGEFPGTVQDMLDAVAAVTAEQTGR